MFNKLTIFSILSILLNLILIGPIFLSLIMNSQNHMNHNAQHSNPSQHSDYNIPENASNIPNIYLKAYKDSKSGYNIELVTTNFMFTPQNEGKTKETYNEGHAHLFVNSKKISRVYSNWIQIPQDLLTDDKNDIRVSLNSNLHEEFHFRGNSIEARAILLKSPSKDFNTKSVSMTDFATIILDNSEIIRLDVRTKQEFDQGHVPNSINIDVQSSSFVQEINNLDKSKKYAVYCRSGNRSLIAFDKLKSNGFTDAINAAEGFTTWEYLKLPIEK